MRMSPKRRPISRWLIVLLVAIGALLALGAFLPSGGRSFFDVTRANRKPSIP
jgi:hypothetical protein